MDDFPILGIQPQIGLTGPRRYVRFPSAPPKRLQQYLSASSGCPFGWSTSFKRCKCPPQDSNLLEGAIPQNGIAVLEARIYPAFTICNIVGKWGYQLIVNRTLWQHGPVTKSHLVAQIRNAFPCFSGSYPHSSTLSPCGVNHRRMRMNIGCPRVNSPINGMFSSAIPTDHEPPF